MKPLTVALVALGSHKTRTFLASLGIMIGIAAVIVMVAIGKGSHHQAYNKYIVNIRNIT